ncbi:MAG: glycosyltransferase family 2 protein [Planctomycetes bacterium]|nr:glycosyltransferase family 2 protein [Planctomycetota bacterium]
MISVAEHDESPRAPDPLVSVVMPLYNEAAVLRTLTGLVEEALQSCRCRYEIVYVNDGSRDESEDLLDEIARENPHVRVVHFSRNFGHQAAVQAGLMFAAGDAIVVMDSDLQDDPAAIPRFLERWREGYDVVYAVRFNRKENLAKRSLFYAFYRVLNAISDTPIPHDAGNFGLIDRRAAEHVVRMYDRDRFYPGLRRWVGFRQIGVPVERLARHDDQPRVTLRQLGRLAKSAVFSFSSFPLTMFYAIAAVSLLACAGLCGFTLYHKLFTGLAIPGWTSMTIAASFFGALNALGIGILGEYVIRIYDQVRARPLFIVQREVNFALRDAEAIGAADVGNALRD